MFSDRIQTALWVGFGIVLLVLLYLLAPILSPFLLGAIVAYICNPLVDKLQRRGMPRLVAVLLVITLVGVIFVGLLLVVIPLAYEEVTLLMQRAPDVLTMANERLVPWLRETFGIRLRLDPASIRKMVNENVDLQNLGGHLFDSLRIGGAALVALVTNAMLVPVVIFYLMLDWHKLVDRVDAAIPREWHAKTQTILGEIDAVLSQFLRGQLLVMLALAVFYSVGLALIGLPSALPVGIITGLLVFIPYLGFGLGFALAIIVALLQFQGIDPVLGVLVVYGIGQVVESFWLTPYLVGERIGLHPLTVLFALMAFGQLFGFVGVLIALPASAALLVGLREVRKLYLASRFYRGTETKLDLEP